MKQQRRNCLHNQKAGLGYCIRMAWKHRHPAGRIWMLGPGQACALWDRQKGFLKRPDRQRRKRCARKTGSAVKNRAGLPARAGI